MKSFNEKMQCLFNDIGEFLIGKLKDNEKLNLNLKAEESDFIRFNFAQVRQSTSLVQATLSATLFQDEKKIKLNFNLSGDLENDRNRANAAFSEARIQVSNLPIDPFSSPPIKNEDSFSTHNGQLINAAQVISEVTSATKGTDFVGFYAGGPIIEANRNSEGQKHWFYTENFFMDYSLYNPQQKAVKGCYAGRHWNNSQWNKHIESDIKQLEKLSLPSKKIPRGKYRVYLSPTATGEYLGMLNWHGMSESAYRRGFCPMKDLKDGKKSLSSKVNINENFSLGLTPRFTSEGEISPELTCLVKNGQHQTFFVNKRTAKEFGVASNGANESESFRSFELESGSLSEKEILKQLDTGLYVSNVHYTNYSDRQTGRITGMTRYACFWVENGKIDHPIEDLRFDESIYHVLGDGLMDLTEFQEIIPSTGTYFSRTTGGMKVPGLLIEDFNFTL